MGTASTMTGLADVLGLCLRVRRRFPQPTATMSACAPPPAGARSRSSGRTSPHKIMTHQAFKNAIAVAMAMGCSTNAVVHILAMARRAGHAIGLEDFDAASRKVPVIANQALRRQVPHGGFLLRGGMLGLMSRLVDHLDLSQINVTGKTWAKSLEGAVVYDDDVIRRSTMPSTTKAHWRC